MLAFSCSGIDRLPGGADVLDGDDTYDDELLDLLRAGDGRARSRRETPYGTKSTAERERQRLLGRGGQSRRELRNEPRHRTRTPV